MSLAALQARALLDAGRCTERDMAEVAARSRATREQPARAAEGRRRPSTSCSTSRTSSRRCARTTARRSPTARAAVVLAAGDRARELCDAAGVDPRHRPPHRAALPRASRDLTRSPSTALAGEKAGVGAAGRVAELHAPFTHQELILRDALGLGDDVDDQPVGRRARRRTR